MSTMLPTDNTIELHHSFKA